MKTVDEIVLEIESGGVEAVMSILGDEGALVLDTVAPIIEAIPNIGVQTTISAMLVGFAFAAIEGELSLYEINHSCFLTAEDRLKLWVACMWAAYREGLESRKHPDCPNPTPTKGVM